MPDTTHTHDILIAGGGLVGASLAVALAPTGYRVGVIEARPVDAEDQPSYDERSTALAWGSRRIFEGLGLWSALSADVSAIRRVHVSERGRFGAARLSASEQGVEALGYVAPNRCIGRVLHTALGEGPVDLIAPARACAIAREPGAMRVEVEGEAGRRSLRARLLVVADGGRSRLRDWLGIRVARHAYGQSAVIANVTPARDHAGVAYERFTPTGPLALLPLGGGRCSLVWTHPPEAVDRLLEMDEATFLRHLGEAFGTRLGRFERVGRRVAYPLERQRANHDVQPRAVLVGNAAHTLHPVAGQGFNLALRDVAALAERLADAARLGADPGDLALLEDYSAARRPDIDRVERDTDLLARLFVHRLPGLGHARAAGLAALELLPALRRRVAERGMGRGAVRARLAQGLPLTNHPT